MNNVHPLIKFFHWAIVVLVIIQFINIAFTAEGHRVTTPDVFLSMHMSFGILVFLFALGLLFMHFFRPIPRIEDEVAGLTEKAVILVKYVLYVLIFTLPFTGWAALNGRGVSLNFFGLFTFPDLMATSSQYARAIGELHGGLAGFIGFLAAGHAVMALYHHFILKDGVLKRMLPKFLVK